MVRLPRIARQLRSQLRVQRRLWVRRWRARSAAGGQVLFPTAGHGSVAIETLAGRIDARADGPRVAILHATAGSGHKRAAEALAAAIGDQRPEAIVREVDTLVFASRFYRETYATSYNVMAARAPALWAALYHSSATDAVNRGTAPMRLAMDRLNLRRLVHVLEHEKADAVVCTHFLPVEVLSPRRASGRLAVPLYCVITDFTAHPFWAFPHVDRYFVASEEVAAELAGHGVAPDRIEVSGIPVDPKFAQPMGRDVARVRAHLERDRPVVLVMGGGAGLGPLVAVAERLAGLAAQPQVVVVCGTNARMRREVEARAGSYGGRLRALGFSREVDVLLEAADLVVTKAGGLTCSEALIKRTPLVIFRPTPGQEVRNAEYLARSQAAVLAQSVEDVATATTNWLGDRGALESARAACAKIAHPDAARTIAERVLVAVGPHATA